MSLGQSLLILVNIVALPISKSKSITPFITLKIEEGIKLPPGDPVIMKISPDKFVTITGAIVLIGFFPGLNLFAVLASLDTTDEPANKAKLFI